MQRLLDEGVGAGVDGRFDAIMDASAAIAHVETTTGVRAAPGGRHPTGTANALIAFTRRGRRVRQYLEVIGPDVEAGWSAERVETFGIHRLESPHVVTFAVRPGDIDAAVAHARATGIASTRRFCRRQAESDLTGIAHDPRPTATRP